jgi:hypothetical protein
MFLKRRWGTGTQIRSGLDPYGPRLCENYMTETVHLGPVGSQIKRILLSM